MYFTSVFNYHQKTWQTVCIGDGGGEVDEL